MRNGSRKEEEKMKRKDRGEGGHVKEKLRRKNSSEMKRKKDEQKKIGEEEEKMLHLRFVFTALLGTLSTGYIAVTGPWPTRSNA